MEKNCIDKARGILQSELYDKMLPFWADKLDTEYGGMPTFIDREGNPFSSDKGVWFQGRVLWTYSFLCNTLGYRQEWIDIAKSCKEFLDKYCFDKDGRMFFLVTKDGRPVRKRRYFFSEAFYIMGNAEYALATEDNLALQNARNVYSKVMKIYNDPSEDPFKVPAKYDPIVRPIRSLANSMIMLNVSSIMRRCDPAHRDFYDECSKNYINTVINCHYHPEKQALLENVGINGEFIDEPIGRTINPGHSIEASWFLIQEALAMHDESLAEKAINIFDWSISRGWDQKYEGINYFVDIENRPVEQYEHDMKLWWPVSEALIASLTIYKHTGDEKYQKWFEKIFDYSFNHFPDEKYGEWVGYLTREGNWQEPVIKSNLYKGFFHVTRMLVMCDEILSDLEN